MPLSRWTSVRILTAGVLASLAVGCAAVPGDPYYDGGGYYPAPSSMTVYEQPGVIYTAPPLGWRDYPPPPSGWREDAWRERQWREARERQWREAQERERREADRRRE
ncbi:hypothetical protein E4O93_24065, partial [Diaphorobacter sp. DS2]